MEARTGNSLTKWDFQITNEKEVVKMGFLDYKWESRFTIHQNKRNSLFYYGLFLLYVE